MNFDALKFNRVYLDVAEHKGSVVGLADLLNVPVTTARNWLEKYGNEKSEIFCPDFPRTTRLIKSKPLRREENELPYVSDAELVAACQDFGVDIDALIGGN